MTSSSPRSVPNPAPLSGDPAMNWDSTYKALLRNKITPQDAAKYMMILSHSGTVTIPVIHDDGSEGHIIVDYNRGGMENAYSISVS
jgi:hypothetical protein